MIIVYSLMAISLLLALRGFIEVFFALRMIRRARRERNRL